MDFNPKDQTRFDPVITEAQSQAWLKVLSSSSTASSFSSLHSLTNYSIVSDGNIESGTPSKNAIKIVTRRKRRLKLLFSLALFNKSYRFSHLWSRNDLSIKVDMTQGKSLVLMGGD